MSARHSTRNHWRFIHGHAFNGKPTPEYRCWGKIKQRCYNQKHRQYCDYGGRGIKVCERWLDSFANFFADMGERPSAKHTIERMNNNGDYEPGNCCWATRREQGRNRRTCHMLTFNGETMCLTAWAQKVGLGPMTLTCRLKTGWSVERALTTPTITKMRNKSFKAKE